MLRKLSPPSQEITVPAVLIMSDATCSWRVARHPGCSPRTLPGAGPDQRTRAGSVCSALAARPWYRGRQASRGPGGWALACGAGSFAVVFVLLAEGVVDALVGCAGLAVDAVGVDLEQDGDAVAGAAGDLGGGDPGVEPQGHGGVAEVVGAAGQR